MPLFAYKALNAQGNVVQGVVQSTLEGLAPLLAKQGLTLICQKNLRPLSLFDPRLVLRPRLNLPGFFGQLAHLLSHKISLPEALELIALTLPKTWRILLHAVHEQLRQGIAFAQALTLIPMPHASFVLSTLGSANETGNLADSCALLQEFFQIQANLRQQQRKALAYPLGVLITLLIVLGVLLRVLVPNLRLLGIEAPSPSQRVLFALSDVALESPGLLVLATLVLLAVLVGLYTWTMRNSTRKGTSYESLLNLNTLAILLQAGVPLKEALDRVEEETSAQARPTLAKLSRQVTSGIAFHKALEATGAFPPSAAKFAKIGEASGTLGMMLTQAATFERQQFLERSRRRIALIQPILLILLGGFMLWMITTLFMPLYNHLT